MTNFKNKDEVPKSREKHTLRQIKINEKHAQNYNADWLIYSVFINNVVREIIIFSIEKAPIDRKSTRAT